MRDLCDGLLPTSAVKLRAIIQVIIFVTVKTDDKSQRQEQTYKDIAIKKDVKYSADV